APTPQTRMRRSCVCSASRTSASSRGIGSMPAAAPTPCAATRRRSFGHYRTRETRRRWRPRTTGRMDNAAWSRDAAGGIDSWTRGHGHERVSMRRRRTKPEPQWYKRAVIYELPVKSFSDANADGIGDFPGLLDRLDYVEALGVSCVWLL